MKKQLSIALLTLALLAVPALSLASEKLSKSDEGDDVRLGCMQTAVTKRDDAIISAWSSFSSSMTEALKTRRNALNTAWGMSSQKERRAAIEEAWKAFKEARKAGTKKYDTARKSAWKTFAIDKKACRGGKDSEGEASDDAL